MDNLLPSRFFSYPSGTYAKNFLALKTPPSSAGFTSIDAEPPRKNLRLSRTRSSHLLPDFFTRPAGLMCKTARNFLCADAIGVAADYPSHLLHSVTPAVISILVISFTTCQNPFSFPRLSPEHTPNQRPPKARSGWFFAPCLSRHPGILTPAQNSSRAPTASLARWPAATL